MALQRAKPLSEQFFNNSLNCSEKSAEPAEGVAGLVRLLSLCFPPPLLDY